MSRLSYKTLFIILFFLLIPIVFLIRINQKSNQVSAAWWDDMWHYRQAINISSHTSTESNVYITTSINIGNTTKAQTDGGDFRFIDQGGNLLSYYISSGIGTTNIIFHINFNSFPAGAQTLYVYYGNPSAPNGFSVSDFSTAATNYTIGSLDSEEVGGGPVAYWKFDEGIGTTLYNSSSNQNNGYFNSPAPNWVDESQCINGKCLSFDGTQSAFSNYDLSWNNTNSISLSFWVKPQNTTDSQRGILGKQYSLYEWSIYQSGSSVSLVYWNTGGGHTNGMDDTWGNVLTANKWTHLVYTWDGSTSRFYADGKIVKTKPATNPSINMNRTNNMMFGGNIYTWGNTYFRGLIDEVKIHNYLRTADQVKQDYVNHGTNVNIGGTSIQTPPGNLVVHYKFDEGAGSIVHNSGTASSTLDASNVNVTLVNEGKVNKALNFTGANVYYVQSNNSLLLNSGQTYSAWVSHASSGWLEGVLTTHNYVTTSNLGINTSNDHFSISIGYTDGSREYNTKVSNFTITQNEWTHVVLKYDNTENSVSFYINGIFDSKWILNKTVKFTENKVLLGQWSNEYLNNSYKFSGLIDEAKIYDYALSEDEIKREFNQSSSVIFSVDKLDVGSTSASALYCVPGSTDPCSPPVAEWKFDEGIGTTVYDTSGNNNNVSLVNTTWSQGKIGKSLSFNGSSSVLDIPDLSFPGQFTYSFWINNNSTDTRMWFSGSSNQKFGTLGGKFFLRVISSSDNTITFPSLNDWHYITLSRDANNKIDLFIDNNQPIRLFGDVAQSGTTYLSVIGRANDGSGQYYQGKLDQIRIYNYARTPAQIAWDYNQGAPIGWWKFDECQGSIAHDSSGIGNTGSIIIGAGGTQTSVGTCNTSGTAWGTGSTGKINSSLSFDGTDDIISIPNHSSYQFGTNDFSISVWIKPSEDLTNYDVVFSKSSALNHNQYVNALFSAYGELRWYFDDSTESLWSHYVTFGANANFTSKWSHILLVRQGTVIKGYLNGKLVSTSSLPDNYNLSNSYSVDLGKEGSIGTYFPGLIDDVRIYNYALTPDQIKQIHNGGAINFN